MTSGTIGRGALLMALPWALAQGAAARVTVAPAEGVAGSRQALVLRVDAACPGATRTEGLAVQMPWGFQVTAAQPLPGWHARLREAVRKNGPLGWPGDALWRVADAASGLPDGQAAEFVLHGRLPAHGGPMVLAVRQLCDGARQADWRLPFDVRPPASELPPRVPVRDARR